MANGMTMKQGLAPVIDRNSRIIILGSLPGDESLRQQRYYSDPRNQFWSLLSSAYDAPIAVTYPERLAFLAEHGVALWDVLESAERRGSSDAAITKPQPNDFGELFTTFPTLRRIGFNGTKAEAFWRRYIRPMPDVPHESLTTELLPSSSATPGRHVPSIEEKCVRWREFLLSG